MAVRTGGMIGTDSPVWPVNAIRLVVSCASGSAGGEVSVTLAISKNILETYLPLECEGVWVEEQSDVAGEVIGSRWESPGVAADTVTR